MWTGLPPALGRDLRRRVATVGAIGVDVKVALPRAPREQVLPDRVDAGLADGRAVIAARLADRDHVLLLAVEAGADEHVAALETKRGRWPARPGGRDEALDRAMDDLVRGVGGKARHACGTDRDLGLGVCPQYLGEDLEPRLRA